MKKTHLNTSRIHNKSVKSEFSVVSSSLPSEKVKTYYILNDASIIIHPIAYDRWM